MPQGFGSHPVDYRKRSHQQKCVAPQLVRPSKLVYRAKALPIRLEGLAKIQGKLMIQKQLCLAIASEDLGTTENIEATLGLCDSEGLDHPKQ